MVDVGTTEAIQTKLDELKALLDKRGVKIVIDVDNVEAYLVPKTHTILPDDAEFDQAKTVDLTDERQLNLPAEHFYWDQHVIVK